MNAPLSPKQIEYWPLAQLKPYARNAKTHDANQVAKIAASMAEFGWTVPVLVADDGELIAGHGRILAAAHLGLAEVPVIVLGHLTGAQRRAYRIADNKLTELGGWDEALLLQELQALLAEDFDLGLIGIPDDELDALLADADDRQEISDDTADADAEGLTDFYGLQRRASREVFMTGEVFLRFRARRPEDGLTVPLQIQMLPSEMLPLNHNAVDGNGNIIRQGIEFDRVGRRVAFHFLRRHPGDSTDPGLSGETVRVPASEVLHIIDPVEAGQLRGVSRFAPAIVKLFLLDQYDDAELDRKKVAAMYAMFVTSPAPDNPLAPPDEEYEVAPGQVVRLDPGEDVTVSAPADSGSTYEPFQYRTLLQISAALGIPYGYLSNDGAKGNFSNSRLSLIEFRRRVSAWQHSVMVFQMCRPVWARFMDTAVLAGALKLPGYDRRRAEYLACNWLPTKWDWVDPLKDANAEIAQIEAGLKSRTQAIAERGYDAEQVDAEIARERDRERRLGLDFRRPGSPAQAPGGGDPNSGDQNAQDQTAQDPNLDPPQDAVPQE